MNIVHLELPHIFTLTVKEYLTDAAALLQKSGHSFQQFDINPNFWKWLLGLSTPHSPRDLFLPLMNASADDAFWPLLRETAAHLNDISRLYGVPVDLRGIRLARPVLNSSYAMCSLVADNFGCGLFSNFFHQLNQRLHFSDAQIIMLGLDSPEGVFWALQLAAWLRSADSAAHICIARHAWENFTLIHHLPDLVKNPWFFSVIDSVILYQEEIPGTLAALARFIEHPPNASGAPQPDKTPDNIALKIADTVHIRPPTQETKTQLRIAKAGYHVPPAYFLAMETPPEHLVYSMALVRNKCFYKKCTFCVQIAKHASDRGYEESAEVARALEGMQELQSRGITMVNFMDEAMRPADVQKFCAGLHERHITMHWVGRMIAAAHPNPQLLNSMKRAGCTEILFGLESFDPALAADMGKISRLHESPAETSAIIHTFLDARLFLILSMIYEFPTERPESRGLTLAAIAHLQSLSDRFAVIFNRFHLLHVSQIYRDPARFNIAHMESRPPENDLQYHFDYQCINAHAPATADELRTMHRLSLGLSEDRYAAALAQYGKPLLDMAYFLDYISIGFRHRAQNDATLFAELTAAADF